MDFVADMLSRTKEQMIRPELEQEVAGMQGAPIEANRELLLEIPVDVVQERVQKSKEGTLEDGGLRVRVAKLEQGDIVVMEGHGYQVVESGKVKYLRDGEIIELGRAGAVDVDVVVPVGHVAHEQMVRGFEAQEAAEGAEQGAGGMEQGEEGDFRGSETAEGEIPRVGNVGEMDQSYLAAVEGGDLETAKGLVDEAGVANNYERETYIHETTSEEAFTEFKVGGPRIKAGQELTGRDIWGNDALSGHAIWFRPGDGRSLADHRKGEKREIPVKLKLLHPLMGDRESVDLTGGFGKEFPQVVQPSDVKRLKELGRDSVVYTDQSGKILEVLVFNPNHIKSAEPVVRDDTGRVIPLSERFDDSTPDIRGGRKSDGFSLEGVSEADLEAEQDAAARRKARERAEEAARAPLQGDSSDVGQGRLFEDTSGQQDMFAGESADAGMDARSQELLSEQQWLESPEGQDRLREAEAEVRRREEKRYVDSLRKKLTAADKGIRDRKIESIRTKPLEGFAERQAELLALQARDAGAGQGQSAAEARLAEMERQSEEARKGAERGPGIMGVKMPWMQTGKPLQGPGEAQEGAPAQKLTDSADAAVNERLNAASSVKPKSWRDWDMDRVKVALRGFKRTFPEIPDSMGFAHTLLKMLPAKRVLAQAHANGWVRLVTEGLGAEQYALFERILVAKDVIRSVEDGLYEGKELPFGWESQEAVEADLARWQAVAEANPDVLQAMERREAVWDALRERAIEAGVLDEYFREDRDYFHRIVMQHLKEDVESTSGTGTGLKDTKKSFQRKRKGGGDFLIDYATAEHQVIADLVYQVELSYLRDQFEDAYDKSRDFRQVARHHNLAAVHGGEENYRRVQSVLNEVAGIKAAAEASGEPLDSADKQHMAQLMESIAEIDVLRPYRAQKAMAVSLLEKATGQKVGELDAMGDDSSLNGIMKAALDGEYGDNARGAGAVWYKSIAAEEAFIKESLQGGYYNWKQGRVDKRAIPEGYREYEFRPGHVMYKAMSVDQRILDEVLAKAMELAPEHIREVLAVAGKHKPWIIPKEIADALDHLDQTSASDPYHGLISKMTTLWSGNKLLAPWHTVGYNMRNAWSDMEMVTQHPGIWGFAKEGARLSWEFNQKGALLNEMYDEMIGLGVMGGQTQTELGQFSRTKWMQAVTGDSPGVVGSYLEWNQGLSQAREDSLRIAAYLYFKSELEQGRKHYGGSVAQHIDDLLARGEIKMAAAQLAKDTLHDYQNPTRFGKTMRHKFGVPFFRFREANTIRIARLIANIGNEAEALAAEKDSDFYKTKAGKAVLVTKLAGIRGALMASFYALVAALNYYRDPEEAEKLRKMGRAGSLYLGKDKDGKSMTINLDGAFVAFMRQFGIQEPFRDFAEVVRGDTSVGEFADTMRRGTWAELVNIQNPLSKAVLEHAFGRQFWPDPAMGRPLNDPVENYLRLISANKLYRRVTGKPIPESERTLSGIMTGWIIKRSDLEADSYYLTRSMVEGFRLNTLDKTVVRGARVEGDNQRGFFRNMYFQAMRYNDTQAETRWLQKYFEAAGDMKGLMTSERNRHPLHGLNNVEQIRFWRSLDESERRIVREAMSFYDRGRVKGSTEASLSEMRRQLRLEQERRSGVR